MLYKDRLVEILRTMDIPKGVDLIGHGVFYTYGRLGYNAVFSPTTKE